MFLIFTYSFIANMSPVFAKKTVPPVPVKTETTSNNTAVAESLPAPITGTTNPVPAPPQSAPITASTSDAGKTAVVKDATSSLTQSLSQGTDEEKKARVESLKRLAEALQKMAQNQQQTQSKSETKTS